MAKFKFYGTLRDHVPDGEMAVNGSHKVGEALAAIAEQHAKLKETLYENSTGTLYEYIVVIINDEQVEFLDDGMETQLAEEDMVKVFPPVSGG